MKNKTNYIYILLYLIAIVAIIIRIVSSDKKLNNDTISNFEKSYFNKLLLSLNIKKDSILFIYLDYQCESCRDKIENLNIKKGGNNVLIIISGNDSVKTSQYLFENLKNNYSYHYSYDKSYNIKDSLKITHVPTMRIIDLKRNTKVNVNSF